ncbi:uncharacterized protein [Arachis hypogaea]|uniref:uncharacterized protein isoform X4 n=1 Tax=Arachis hypogaea TaxID=3818 RepID=UPI003B21C608
MTILSGSMLFSGGSSPETTLHQSGRVKGLMIDQEETEGTGKLRILVWEDGFCNFAASAAAPEINSGLQPELFFKMSHEIYNYGEGLIGKVAADHSHKWIYKEPNEQEINFLSAWHNSADSHPRTWEAQFQSGIKTIALIAVREGVVQLGAVHKVIEDLSYVVLLRKKFSYIESIPGVLLPHPSSSAYPYKVEGVVGYGNIPEHVNHHHHHWHHHFQGTVIPPPTPSTAAELFYDHHFNNGNSTMALKITPSMSSLEALLSKLPSVVPPQSQQEQRALELMGIQKVVAKEELDNDEVYRPELDVGESSSSMHQAYHHHHHQQQHHFHHHNNNNNNNNNNNVTSSGANNNNAF